MLFFLGTQVGKVFANTVPVFLQGMNSRWTQTGKPWESASRRRAEAALWRAAKAEGLAHSKTLARARAIVMRASVLECGGPPPLSHARDVF